MMMVDVGNNECDLVSALICSDDALAYFDK